MIEREIFYLSYNTLYFFIGFFLLLTSFKISLKGGANVILKQNYFISKIIILLLILFVGLRSFKTGTDTINYYSYWLREENFNFGTDFLLYAILTGLKKIGFSYQFFLLTISFLFFLTLYRAYRNLTKAFKVNLLFFLFCFLSFFFSLTTSINVIRQGLSLVFLILAFSYYKVNKKKLHIILIVCISLSFHLTAIIPIALFYISKRVKHLNMFFFIVLYLSSITFSLLNRGLLDISPFIEDILQDDKRLAYLNQDEKLYEIGFKPQFVIFNSIFLILSFYIKKKYRLGESYKVYIIYYILSSSLFYLAFQMIFSDRWGLFSWFFIPILLHPLFRIVQSDFKHLPLVVISLIGIFTYFALYA